MLFRLIFIKILFNFSAVRPIKIQRPIMTEGEMIISIFVELRLVTRIVGLRMN